MATSNPARAWHHIQVRDPKRYKIVSTIQLGKKAEETNRSEHGIQARLGIEKGVKGAKTEWVILLFDPRLWTLDRAKAWVKKHKRVVMEAVEAPEQPEHELSTRARAIKHGRLKTETRQDEVAFLKKHGVGCEVAVGSAKAVCQAVMAVSDDPAVVYSMTHGRFTDGERDLIVVLPHDDVVRAVNSALRKALSVERGKNSEVVSGLRSLVGCMTSLAQKKIGAKR